MVAEIKLTYEFYYKACSLASEFHKDQIDKGGAPYYNHPLRVADSIFNDYDFDIIDDKQQIFIIKCATVAVMHDLLEDTECTEDYLREIGFSEDIIDGVKSVTRNENESYGDFVKRAAKNQYGKIVKLHDLEDNLDIKRLNKLTESDISRINKYLKWYHFLKQ